MSFRRKPSRRQGGPSSPSLAATEESVENPNAFGIFGHQYQAPAAVQVDDNEGHTHSHSPQYAEHNTGWHSVHVHNPPHHDPHHQHHDHHQHSNQQQQNWHQHHSSDPSGDYMGPTASEGHAPLVYSQPTVSQTQLGLHPPISPELKRQQSNHSSEHIDFELVHSAKSGHHLQEYSAALPLHWKHLFKRPVIRQWVLQDKLYREVDDRQPSQFELFFDLVMVGIIHMLADGAAEAATGLNVAKFILVFYPAWSIWTDVRGYINVSGTDDICQRIYILVNMMLLVGYAANATGIIIEKQEEPLAEAEIATAAGGHGDATADLTAEHGVERRAVAALVGGAASYIAKRSESDGSGVEPVLVREIAHTGYWFASGWHAAIASAIAFYLVAKLCRLLLFFLYGALLPKFRKALWLNMISLIVISCVYLPIIFITEPGIIVVLVGAGILLELSSRFIVAAIMQKLHGTAKHKGHKTYMPAYSLPHLMERMTQFTILVVGESILNATYVAYAGNYGAQSQYWRACLAIVIPFMLIWLYFDNDSSRTFVHGLKRHWFTSISFTHLHFPLCASLILMSSALVKLIKQEAVEIGYLWFFSASTCTAVTCIGLLGMLHKSLDVWGSSAIPKSARISVRFIVAAIFGVMPLLYHWKSVEFLGAHAGLLTLLVAFETFGKLGAYGRKYDPIRAEELRKKRKQANGDLAPDSIPMSNISTFGSPATEKRQHHRRLSIAANDLLHTATKKISKDSTVKGPGRRASWHEYDDLTEAERGEEDCGVESQLGDLQSREVSSGERWAYVAT